MTKKYNYTKKTGRPSKYDKKYCQMLVDFMSTTSHEVYQDVTYYKDGTVHTETNKLIANTFPTLMRFAHNIDVDVDILSDWATVKFPEDYPIQSKRGKLQYPEFNRAFKKAKKIQESILVENALQGSYNSQFAMFIAKNNFGYKDKTEVDQNHTGDLSIHQVLDKIIKKKQ